MGFFQLIWYRLCDPRMQFFLKIALSVSLSLCCVNTFADNSEDILSGTDASLWATINGTGKKYIYAAEGIIGLGTYMKTKNLLVLTGIVVVSVFFNILIHIANGTN